MSTYQQPCCWWGGGIGGGGVGVGGIGCVVVVGGGGGGGGVNTSFSSTHHRPLCPQYLYTNSIGFAVGIGIYNFLTGLMQGNPVGQALMGGVVWFLIFKVIDYKSQITSH